MLCDCACAYTMLIPYTGLARRHLHIIVHLESVGAQCICCPHNLKIVGAHAPPAPPLPPPMHKDTAHGRPKMLSIALVVQMDHGSANCTFVFVALERTRARLRSAQRLRMGMTVRHLHSGSLRHPKANFVCCNSLPSGEALLRLMNK